MRVLHLAAGNLFGGIETYLLTLARLRHMCPEMEPHFGVCFPGRLREELTASGVPIHDLGPVRVSRPWTLLRGRSRLKRIVREHRHQVVVTHGCWPHAVFAPAIRKVGVGLITAIHDYLDGRHWINRWAARTLPDAVVANSHYTAPSAAALFPGVPVEPVYLPVPPPTVDRTSARTQLRAELDTPTEAVVILQASRLERWKGHAVHFEALARLKDLSGWVAWIAGGPQKAGEGEFLDELKAAAGKTGIADRIRFLGQRSDVPRLMAAADVYCQPNVGPEPFGLVFVEALYSGLPVVASNSGGAVEIVTNACGVLCPPGDAGAVANALRDLIAEPRRRQALGAVGQIRAAELCEPMSQIGALAGSLLAGVR